MRNKAFFIPRRQTAIMIAVIFLLVLFITATRPENSHEEAVFSYGLASQIIVIDAGHGGLDQGATRGNYAEHDITLEIAKKLEANLSQAGAAVIMLRENESDLAGDEFSGTIRQHKNADMKSRVTIANEAKANLYISIHVNAVPSSGWSGAQAFYRPKSEESKIIARSIQQELTGILGNTKRKAAPGAYYVLNNVDMPAVLIESGFISNPQEARLLANEEYQSKVAYAIFAGVARAAIYNNEISAETE